MKVTQKVWVRVEVEVVQEGLLVLCSMLASSLLLFLHLEQS